MLFTKNFKMGGDEEMRGQQNDVHDTPNFSFVFFFFTYTLAQGCHGTNPRTYVGEWDDFAISKHGNN
jgi:hypothetical protein